MTGTLFLIAFAAFEAELAHAAGRAGDETRRRKHGGWSIICGAIAILLFLVQLIFG